MNKIKEAMAKVEQKEANDDIAAYIPPSFKPAPSPTGGVIDQFFTDKDAKRLNDFNDAYITFIEQIDSVDKLLTARLYEIREFRKAVTKGQS